MFGSRVGFSGTADLTTLIPFQKKSKMAAAATRRGRHLGKFSNGHISATGRPIPFMFGSRVGFSGTADPMAVFSVQKIQDGGRRHFRKISNTHISATGRLILFIFGSRMGFSGTAD